PRDWLLLLALVAMWGSSFLLTKLAVATLPPTAVVAGRLSIAALVLAILALARGHRPPASATLWGYLIAMGVVGSSLPFFLISWGQQHIDSALAGILMAVMPLVTLVLAHFLVAGERLSGPKVGGFLLGFAGIVVLMGPEALLRLRGQGAELLPQLAVLAGAVCYGVNTIIARRRPASEPLVAAAGVMVVASLVMVPITPWDAFAGLEIGTPATWAVLGLGLVCTALATVVYFALITSAGPTFLSLINYLIPLWALALGALFLGERLDWNALVALGLILLGVGLSQRRPPVATEQV
ncbi:MAG: DMT family transporter, partial [Candidatus Competibacteraceae bacterium]|nr:DMT family transporter [Candidatus Competibacteraceae bacterium]